MAEYIEREVLYKTIAKNVEAFDDAGANIKEQCLEHIVIAEPSADVVEVKHGEWLRDIDWEYDYYCSVCNGSACKGDYGNYDVLTDYCPNCGAKMDGKRSDNNG